MFDESMITYVDESSVGHFCGRRMPTLFFSCNRESDDWTRKGLIDHAGVVELANGCSRSLRSDPVELSRGLSSWTSAVDVWFCG